MSAIPRFLYTTRVLTVAALSLVSGLYSCRKPPPADSQSVRGPIRCSPVVIGSIPHDSSVFTQGLFFFDGRLYESSGLYGKSRLRVLDARTGMPVKEIQLADGIFAEGCARLENTLIQLTWKEQAALRYSFPDLSFINTLSYRGEGWGLTSDSGSWYMSNGSDTITVRNRSFEIARTIPVRFQQKPVRSLNELEFVNGCIYANVWYSDDIFVVDPHRGAVVKIIDCSDLVIKERPSSIDCVLNGIAYNRDSGYFYVTGKKWKTIFIVRIP